MSGVSSSPRTTRSSVFPLPNEEKSEGLRLMDAGTCWKQLVCYAGLACAVAACGGEPRERASVEIVEPADGALLVGSDSRVVLSVTGVEITPATVERKGTAHHHLFVDREVTPLQDTIPAGVTGILHLGRGQTEFVLKDLAPGEHRVIVLLADRHHVPLRPPAADTVRFTIQPPETE